MDREGSCRLPKKRTEIVTLLEKLKTGQKDSIQRVCIDSICSLLTEKEMQMMALLQLVADTPDTEEIIHQAAAVSQKVRSASHQKEMVAVAADTEKKRNFRSIFRKREKNQLTPCDGKKGRGKWFLPPFPMLTRLASSLPHCCIPLKGRLTMRTMRKPCQPI